MESIIPELHEAARNNEVDRTMDLLRRFELAPQMAESANGLTPAHVAALSGSVDVLRTLVEFSGEDSEFVATAEDKQGLTVLHYAALGGDPGVVEFLLAQFGHSATSRNNNGGLPTHFAAGAGHLDVLRMLVKHTGAHLANNKDSTGTTPAYFAAQEGHLDCLKFLCIEAFADKLSRAGDGMTTLHGATQGGHFETVKWIVQQMGPRVMEDRSDDGATPVHFAAASGHDDILAYFLQQGRSEVLVSCSDNENATPAHDAVEYGHLNALKILIQFNADLNIEDDDGESPFSLAVSRPSDDPINIFVTEYMRLSPVTKPHHSHVTSSHSSVVSHDTSGQKVPKTSKQEATEIKLAANQASEFLTFRTKQKRELQAAARAARERKKVQKRDSFEATKNRLLAYDPPASSLPSTPLPPEGSRRRSKSQENILEAPVVTKSEFSSPRSKHQSHVRHRPPHVHRRPYGYIHPEEVLLDKFVTQGYGLPPPPLKNLRHAKRVDLSQVSELVKRRESIRTRKDVILYRRKQLQVLKEPALSKKKILKYEDIQRKLDTPAQDTFEPPAPPITLSSQLEGKGWEQFIETDSNHDSVDERFNIAAGIEIATVALLAPSCLSAFTSVLPEDTFVALEGKIGRKEKEIKLGKMKHTQGQVGGVNDEDSGQSDDPFVYDEIEARRRGWDETAGNEYPSRKDSKHLIGSEEPGDIIASKDKSRGRKKKGNISRRVQRSRHQVPDSQSEGSIASYASDGEPIQPELEPELGTEISRTESFEAPKFISPAVKIRSGPPEHLSGTLTPNISEEVRVEVNEKYSLQVLRPKSKTEPISDAEIKALTLPSPELELEPTKGVKSQASEMVAKESLKPARSGVTRTTEGRRKNVHIPTTIKQQSTTTAVLTKTNKITLSSSSNSTASAEESVDDQLIQKSEEAISGTVVDSGLSQSNEDLNAILRELDLIGLDLQMELENISTVTTPPSKPRDSSRHKNVPSLKTEQKLSKPEQKLPKMELKTPKLEPQISKPAPKVTSANSELKPQINPTKEPINSPDPADSRTEGRTDQSHSGEVKARSRGVRMSAGLKLSYNAENNYPDSAVSLNTDGSSIVSSASRISKQESDLHFQIEQHGLLVDQAASANQIYTDKHKQLQLELSRTDDLIRKRSFAYEQAQTNLRKVSVSNREPFLFEEAKKRAEKSLNSLDEARSKHENIKQQIEVHIQQLDDLEKTIEQMRTFKIQQNKLLKQISEGVEVDKPSINEPTDVKPELNPSLEVTKEKPESDSSGDDTELIPPAESWKLISSQLTSQQPQRVTNTDIRDSFNPRTPEVRSGQSTPRTLELTETSRGHISITSLKRRGEKKGSASSIGPIPEDTKQQESHSGKKSTTLPPKEEFCFVCELRVYPTEKYVFEGKVLHQTCIKCSVCRRWLSIKELKIKNNILFCKTHFPY